MLSERPSRKRSKCRSPAASSMLRSSAFSLTQTSGRLYVAGHKHAEGDAQAFANALMK